MKIISRDEWGAMFGRGDEDAGPEPRVVIHHSYLPALSIQTEADHEAAAVRSIERFHVHSNGWSGIGYNFLVAPSGRVYEGRGWKYRGSHAGPVNGSSIGVCLLINGSETPATEQTILSVRALIAEGIRLDELAANYVISGHRDHMPRTCPGDKVYAQLPLFRHDAEIPDVEPSVVPHRPIPPAMNLEKVFIPRREHVEEVVRVRGLSRELVEPGLRVMEALLRAVVRGQKVSVKAEIAKAAADAAADYLKDRTRTGD